MVLKGLVVVICAMVPKILVRHALELLMSP